jgi:hypothetical protein
LQRTIGNRGTAQVLAREKDEWTVVFQSAKRQTLSIGAAR